MELVALQLSLILGLQIPHRQNGCHQSLSQRSRSRERGCAGRETPIHAVRRLHHGDCLLAVKAVEQAPDNRVVVGRLCRLREDREQLPRHQVRPRQRRTFRLPCHQHRKPEAVGRMAAEEPGRCHQHASWYERHRPAEQGCHRYHCLVHDSGEANAGAQPKDQDCGMFLLS